MKLRRSSWILIGSFVLVALALLVLLVMALRSDSSSQDGASSTSTTSPTDTTDTTDTTDPSWTDPSAPDQTTPNGGAAPVAPSGPAGGGGGGAAPATNPADPDLYVMPNITGMNRFDADALVTSRGLVVGFTLLVDDWQVAANTVTSQDQTVGAYLGPGGIVSYRWSAGPMSVLVPSVVNQCVNAAMETLRRAGFYSQVNYVQDPARTYHRVYQQNPNGVFQQQGSVIQLWSSSALVDFDGCD